MREEITEVQLNRRTRAVQRAKDFAQLTTAEVIAARDAAFEEALTFGTRHDAAHAERSAELAALQGGDDSLVAQIAQQLEMLEAQRKQLSSLLAKLEERV